MCDYITPHIEPGLLLHGTCAVCNVSCDDYRITDRQATPVQRTQSKTNTHSAWMSYSIHLEVLALLTICIVCEWSRLMQGQVNAHKIHKSDLIVRSMLLYNTQVSFVTMLAKVCFAIKWRSQNICSVINC